MVKQPQQEFHPQHPAAGPADHFPVQPAAEHHFLQSLLPFPVLKVIQLQIHPGLQPHGHGFLLGCRQIVVVPQPLHRRQVGPHEAPHAPLVPQYLRQQFVIRRHRNAVNRVVGAHGVHRPGFPESRLEHGQAVAEHLMPAHSAGRAVDPAHRCAVPGIVLRLRGDGVRIAQLLSLHSLHHGPGKFGTQMGVLPVGFLRPSVSRIPDQVHHRAPGLMDPHGPAFRADGPPHPLAHFRMKGGRQADLLGKHRGRPVAQAMQGLLAEQKGNAQPCLFHGIPLQRVDLRRRQLPRLNAPAAVPLQQAVQPLHVQRHPAVFPVPRGEVVGIILVRLQDHLLQRHLLQQLLHPPVNPFHLRRACAHMLLLHFLIPSYIAPSNARDGSLP